MPEYYYIAVNSRFLILRNDKNFVPSAFQYTH